MFKGTQYVRLNGTTVDAGPRPISVGWTGLPQSFLSGIDAAVYRPSNGKYYLFKDHQYVRMSDNGSTIDIDTDGNNYPLDIGDVWDLPAATAAAGIDAAIWHGDKEKLYLFAGNDYFRVSRGVPCLMRSNSPEVCFYTTSHLGWNGFLTGIDAAVYRGDSQAAYLFSGEWYARFSDIGGEMDAEYPKRIRHGFNNLDEAFHRDLDAALWRESTGQTYLFKGDQYVRLTETVADTNRDYPCPIDPVWTGLPGSGLPRVDAALMRQDTNQIYLFHRRAYVRYSNLADGPDDDYPAWIDKRWMSFPRS